MKPLFHLLPEFYKYKTKTLIIFTSVMITVYELLLQIYIYYANAFFLVLTDISYTINTYYLIELIIFPTYFTFLT